MLRKFGSTSIFFYTLIWLMVLLVLGTLAQREMGLYQAKQLYFASWIFWLGFFPLPGGRLTMAVLFVNLLCKLLFDLKFQWIKTGVIITHFGSLLFLGGGMVTAYFSNEGSMMIPEGERSGYYEDYHKMELAVINTTPEDYNEVTAFSGPHLLQGANFKAGDLPIRILELTDTLKIETSGNEYTLRQGDSLQLGRHLLSLRKKRYILPFEIKLIDFEKKLYPGTLSARSYKSSIEILEDDRQRRTDIVMNKPLRNRGYTFYQSSFIEGKLGEQATVLAVAQNPGRLFPYISSIIICLGLLLHLFIKMPRILQPSLLTTIFFLVTFPVCGAGLEQMVIQHEGRLKPLDSFARIQLLMYHGKSKMDGVSAMDWMKGVLFTPQKSYTQRLFRVRNEEVIIALGLKPEKKQRYSFEALNQAMQNNMEMLHGLHMAKAENRNLVDNQLLELYIKTTQFYDLSRSFSGLFQDILMPDGKRASYFHFLKKQDEMRTQLEALKHKQHEEFDETDHAFINLMSTLGAKLRDRPSIIFRIIPPDKKEKFAIWLSPWALMDGRELSPEQNAYLLMLENMVNQIASGNQAAQSIKNYLEKTNAFQLTRGEILYNRATFFFYSKLLYLSAFFILLIGLFFKSRRVWLLTFLLLLSGAVLHGMGIIMRIYIMKRPPVSNLYESILFVGLVIVLLALYLEFKRRQTVGLFVASIGGTVLQFISSGYAADGDTMGMLAPVLISNFWLSTHVITIVIGYGASFVAGLLGHAYLIFKVLKSDKYKGLEKTMLGMTLLAMFFIILGTILGGIWADQSWGRFWGWDPKENGALLIILWLLLLNHGRISKILNETSFAVGLVLLNIVVALAWFGVNLLNVGLHSYGYTGNIVMYLTLFCGIELLFATFCWIFCKLKMFEHNQ